ncbi:TRAP transporter solute receptor, unknown substrate 6 [hydrothermal vent metagenome]|uniref:TRAP-type C4-dicarboxylate transport system, periplasmic component n=1 Tax=hydrothermal vent metagenome TaxID=652676 RepID=A0A3B0TW87_9ZZZZ
MKDEFLGAELAAKGASDPARTGTTSPHPARRDVLALGGAATIGLATPAIAQTTPESILWRMATPWPRKMPGFFAAAERLAGSITAMSGGRLKVTAYPAGKEVAPAKIFNAVSEGTIELAHASAHLWADKNPAFHYFTGMPFGLTASEHAGWIYFGGGQALWEQAYSSYDVLPFLAGNTGPQAGGWFQREIRNPEDFKGLKFRISGLGADVLRHLGAKPVALPPSDIFPAMQSGQLDGTEWVGPWNDLVFGFHKLARYYYLPAFQKIGSALELIVNAEAFGALTSDLRDIVRRAAMAASAETCADFTYNNALALDLIDTRTSTIISAFPDNVIRALGEASAQIADDLGATSRFSRTVHSSYFGYLGKAVPYSGASDLFTLRQRQSVQK